MRAETGIYLFLVVGAILSAGPMALGADEKTSFALGYGALALAIAVVLYLRHRRRQRQPP